MAKDIERCMVQDSFNWRWWLWYQTQCFLV